MKLVKEFSGKKRGYRYEGWIEAAIGNFGLGFSTHSYRGRISQGTNLNISFIFLDIHIEFWKPR